MAMKPITFTGVEHAQIARALELQETSLRRAANSKSLLPFAKEGYVNEANAIAALRTKMAAAAA